MTTGEKLVQLSSLSTGTALEHLLHIQQSTTNAPTIHALDIISTTGVGVNDGEITILASGGTTPYEYSIGGTYQIDNTFINLSEDTYTVSVKDISGYTDTISGIKLSAPANTPIITEIITIDASSNVISDGSIETIVNGGTAPYEYALNDGTYQSSNMFMKLLAGVYSITVKDDNDVITKLSGIKISGARIVGGGCGAAGGAAVNSFRPSIRIKNVKINDVDNTKKIKVKVTL